MVWDHEAGGSSPPTPTKKCDEHVGDQQISCGRGRERRSRDGGESGSRGSPPGENV